MLIQLGLLFLFLFFLVSCSIVLVISSLTGLVLTAPREPDLSNHLLLWTLRWFGYSAVGTVVFPVWLQWVVTVKHVKGVHSWGQKKAT